MRIPLAAMFAVAAVAAAEGGAPVPLEQIGSIAWEPTVISFAPDCATWAWKPRVTDNFEKCILEPVVDTSGELHVFVKEPLAAKAGSAPADMVPAIQHFVFKEGEMKRLASVPMTHAPATALRAVSMRDGTLVLAWVEDLYPRTGSEPKHEPALYLSRYRNGGWSDRMTGFDTEARPSFLWQDELALFANDDDSLDVYWNDDREQPHLPDRETTDGPPPYRKTFHRRLLGSTWSEPERIQPRGAGRPYAFAATPGTDPREVFWSESSGLTAKIRASRLREGRWRDEGTIAECKSAVWRPEIREIQVRLEKTSVAVAWVCEHSERPEPGSHEDHSLYDLYASTNSGETWKTGPVLSHVAQSIHWIWNDSGRSGLLVQEMIAHPLSSVRVGDPLYIETIEGGRSMGHELFAQQAVEQSIFTVTDPGGTVHVIYAEPTSNTEAVFKYRHGKYKRKTAPARVSTSTGGIPSE